MSLGSWISAFPLFQYGNELIQRGLYEVLATGTLPQHIGFIMDGNRRYAKERQVEVKEGHTSGFESLLELLDILYRIKIPMITVYAFSVENFHRPPHEVQAIMELVQRSVVQLCQLGDFADQYDVQVRILGDRSLIPPLVDAAIETAVQRTIKNKTAVLNICFAYTARLDIALSMRSIVKESKEGRFKSPITQQTIEQHMFSKGDPPVDILIRSSGAQRLSDFLLWECNDDTLIAFVDCYWPMFTGFQLFKILLRWSLLYSTKIKRKLIYSDQN
ncbi:hypothetical protein CANCADRAFT_56760 [Tortispora caseinolytica NRRL Y-17796]|uniref:Alkyl transferase n=1 Tax=Tortispora caseinolytica NRRL Y-17796 TaxID=767744 RepID=A0A1E4TEJ9_9ASCO|nr:hypothetical protein CANCADRAFT_56760 [Tortispora caseinolytica NRRL Y-17796]